MERRSKLRLFLWSGLILISAQAVMYYAAAQVKAYLEANQIVPPEVGLGIPLAYFFGAVAVMGLVLFLVPIAKLRLVFKALFTLLYVWGIVIILGLSLPLQVALGIALAVGAVWFFWPRVWLHNLLMVLALASVGALLGFLFSPWTVIILLFVLSIYDILAVRFGYMVWMAKRLSETETLPAFVIPERVGTWNMSLKETGFRKLSEDNPPEVEVSILGGGDIGLPLLLLGSVYFNYGFARSLVVAVFLLAGLISAFWIQTTFLKGKPLPALPPITLAALIGFLIVRFLIQG